MNYLALSALHKVFISQSDTGCQQILTKLSQTYGAQEGPYQKRAQEIYTELRKNVIDNVHKEYERTGYVWEQYDPKTGEGRRR